jgi:hypothetical protein
MKCEHGLTTKECYVCMSPKYGKHDTKQERVANPQGEEHMSIEAMKQALEALEYIHEGANNQGPHTGISWRCASSKAEPAITSLRQAIEQAEKQEPVAWMHTKIEGVAVPHRPADLDKHPDRWESLYKTPPPCPTCEALARTVMMDQTGRDA